MLHNVINSSLTVLSYKFKGIPSESSGKSEKLNMSYLISTTILVTNIGLQLHEKMKIFSLIEIFTYHFYAGLQTRKLKNVYRCKQRSRFYSISV
jgi:hypothetical protein